MKPKLPKVEIILKKIIQPLAVQGHNTTTIDGTCLKTKKKLGDF